MNLFALLIVSVVVLLVGRLLVRFLGWPRDIHGIAHWGIALLVLAVLFAGLPEVLRSRALLRATWPSVSFVELVPILPIVGLAILGYVAWVRGATERDREARLDERARFMPRLPARPHVPELHEDNHIFEPVAPHDDGRE